MMISTQPGSLLEHYGTEGAIRLLSEAGFGGMDIGLDKISYSDIVNGKCSGFFDQTDEEMLEYCRPFKEAAEKYGMKYIQAHAPFPNWVNNEATDRYVLEAVKKCIMMCGYLNCEYLIVHPGFLSYDAHATEAQEWDYNMHMYGELIPVLKQYGVKCCLENMFSGHRGKIMEAICSDNDEAIRYIDALNEMAGEELFGFCLDVGHYNVLGRDPYEAIHALGHRIWTLHVHDNDGLHDEHTLPYMGVIDWDRVCLALKEIGYSHDVNFETGGGVRGFDPALAPQVLRLLCATGELFRRKITGE